MNFFESKFTKIDETNIGFDGSGQPALITEDTAGQESSVSYDPTGGGCAVLSTGAGGTGDYARIDGGPVSIGDYNGNFDAISFHTAIRLNDAAAVENDSITFVGLHDGDNSHKIDSVINHGLSRRVGIIDVTNGGADTNYVTRDVLGTQDNIIPIEILWHSDENTIYHRCQNTLAQVVTENIDDTLDYYFTAMTISNNTTIDKIMRVYKAKIGYWKHR